VNLEINFPSLDQLTSVSKAQLLIVITGDLKSQISRQTGGGRGGGKVRGNGDFIASPQAHTPRFNQIDSEESISVPILANPFHFVKPQSRFLWGCFLPFFYFFIGNLRELMADIKSIHKSQFSVISSNGRKGCGGGRVQG